MLATKGSAQKKDAALNTFFFRTMLFFLVQHTYLFWHFRTLLGKKRIVWAALPWFLCMGLSPLVFISLPPDSQMQNAFREINIIWQAFAYFCMLLCLVYDVLRGGKWLRKCLFSAIGWQRNTLQIKASRCLPACGAIALAALVFGYGLYESASPRLTRLEIATDKLPAELESIRLVFVSDLHISPRFGGKRLEQVVDSILAQKPDCVLLGGDIVDDARQGTAGDFAQLERLQAPLGTFAVLGNHDAFGDAARPAAALREAGITVLSAQKAQVGPLDIIGVDDPLVSEQKNMVTSDPAPLLQQVNPQRFTILLDHSPTLRPEKFGYFDLQLSGHTHGGQLFFLEPLVRRAFHTPTGLATHTGPHGTSQVFTSTGFGFSKLPIRLMVPPEVVVLDIKQRK